MWSVAGAASSPETVLKQHACLKGVSGAVLSREVKAASMRPSSSEICLEHLHLLNRTALAVCT